MPSTSLSDVHIGQNGEWKVPRARWLAIMLAVVLLEAVCFYALSLFAMDTTHLVWMSVNLGALMFGPVIWREHRRLWSKGASASERQAERRREQERRNREELHREVQETERQHLAELQREAERQRPQAEEGREAERRFQQGRDPAAAQCPTEAWWRVLEVTPSATKDEIVCNYRRKIRQCHPDRVAGLSSEFRELAEERSKALNAAYAQAMRAQR
jgi:DnaJ-domain-containing protein 1